MSAWKWISQSTSRSFASSVQLAAMRPDYNRCSSGQRQLLKQFLPLLDAAVAAHSSFDRSGESACAGPFVIADFGCSTGLNSSDAVSHVIGRIRHRYGILRCPTVLAVLNDLPRNGWNELFRFIHGDERSFLGQHQGVFSLSSGKTFYEQVLPSDTLQFGISSVCLQWCSRLPVKMANHCISMFAPPDEREQFRRQAAQDWENFLTARSRELVSGGVLAVNFVTTTEKANGLYEAIETAAKALHERGVVSEAELTNFNYRMHFRALEEVTDRQVYESLGLELLVAEKFPPENSVFYQDYLRHKDAHRFALDCTSAMSSACESTFLDALASERTEHEKRLACSELWKEYARRIAENPGKVSDIWGSIGVLVRKK